MIYRVLLGLVNDALLVPLSYNWRPKAQNGLRNTWYYTICIIHFTFSLFQISSLTNQESPWGVAF